MRIVVLVLLLLFVPLTARASPRAPADDTERDADVDVDPEDAVVVGAGRRAPPEPSGSTSLSIVGFARENDAGGMSNVGGMIMLALPFDRFARGSTRATDFVRTAAVTAAPANASVAAATEPFELALSPRLARSCVNAAWRAAGLSGDDARLDAIVSRAHWSALLPEARLRAIRYNSASLYAALDPLGTPTYFHDTTGGNLGLEARLTWRFDRLVYADDEPSLERIRLEQRDARSRIAGKALEMLFHWQRAQLDLKTLPPLQVGTRDEADVILRIMEAEAALDVLTNGWFSTHKPKRGVSSSL